MPLSHQDCLEHPTTTQTAIVQHCLLYTTSSYHMQQRYRLNVLGYEQIDKWIRSPQPRP